MENREKVGVVIPHALALILFVFSLDIDDSVNRSFLRYCAIISGGAAIIIDMILLIEYACRKK